MGLAGRKHGSGGSLMEERTQGARLKFGQRESANHILLSNYTFPMLNYVKWFLMIFLNNLLISISLIIFFAV